MKTAQSRDRQTSYKNAYNALILELDMIYNQYKKNIIDDERSNLVGSGERGDKVRTYRFQDDRVTDHKTGKTASCKKVMSGNFQLLW